MPHSEEACVLLRGLHFLSTRPWYARRMLEERMAKVGRNAPCPCGNGKKFKKCHGAPKEASVKRPPGPPQEVFEALMRRAQAKQAQTVRQQGHGRPIVSNEFKGTRFVVVGKEVAYGPWKIFPDFLLHYVRARLGFEWGEAEKGKPELERHPFVRWWEVFGAQRERHTTSADGINTMPMYGAASAVLGLAYDLYTIEHNAEDEQATASFQRMLARLRIADQFMGARHEARAAGMLLRAGFKLAWEDEHVRQDGGHGEFVATFPETGRSFWVECKMRQPEREDARFRYTHLVSEALQKATDLERLVFVELAYNGAPLNEETGGWAGIAVNQLRTLEQQPTSLPAALVVLTNFPEHWQLDQPMAGTGVVMEGFGTDRYRMGQEEELLAAIEVKERNREIEFLWTSLQKHLSTPITFDGSLPGVDPDRQLVLGRSYPLPDGQLGVLEEATVVEQWKQAACFMRRADGTRIMVNIDLSEDELDAWKRHPDTFFGELRPHHPPAKNAMDLYEFFHSSYVNTPKERLLEFMAHHHNLAELRGLPQPELAKRYAYALTAAVVKDAPAPAPPIWQKRLRKPLTRE